MRTRAVLISLLLGACAAKSKGAAERPRGVVPDASVAADPCAPAAFAGAWVIERGTADLVCEDGTSTSVPAGGHVRVDATGGALGLVDGACRFPLTRRGCAVAGGPGVACRDGDVAYTSKEIELSRDGAGGFALTYALEHPDPDDAKRKCVASTKARLARAAADPSKCSLEGRWTAPTTADGKPGSTSFTVGQGRCTFSGPGHLSGGPCTRTGDTLAITDQGGQSACKSGTATWVITFTEDCAALELEARSEPCENRRETVEFLFLRR